MVYNGITFDVQNKAQSNVAGLDPEIMKYVKAKELQFYECNASEINDEWKKCIKSIDDKSRALKKRKTSEMKVTDIFLNYPKGEDVEN